MTINQKFKDLIPPLSTEEYQMLKDSIKTDGVRDKLIVWNGTLIDGHNRYEICQELGISFEMQEIYFESEEEAEEWIMRNQLARRNLSDIERIRIAEKLRDKIEAKAKVQQGKRNDLNILTKSSKSAPVNTRKELATLAGVSEDTYRKAVAVDREAPEPVKQAMGKIIPINKAFQINTVLKNQPEEKREQEAQRLIDDAMQKEREERNKEFKKINQRYAISRVINNIINAAGGTAINYVTPENVQIALEIETCSVEEYLERIDESIHTLSELKRLFQENLERRIIKIYE